MTNLYPEQLFLIEHELIENSSTITHLLRYDLTPISLADLYGVVKFGDWNILYDTLILVNWYAFSRRLIDQIRKHTPRPQHNCCILCRQFLAELGLFLHKMHARVLKTTTTLFKHYDFKLTSDNVDFNGILDFEDYFEHEKSFELVDLLRHMQPYYHTLYSIYEHVGMYFITQPIYNQPIAITEEHDLLYHFEQAMQVLRTSNYEDEQNEEIYVYRPTMEQYSEYMQLNTYAMRPEPLWNTYDNVENFKLDYPWMHNVDLTLTATMSENLYVNLDEPVEYVYYRSTQIDCMISYDNLHNVSYYMTQFEANSINVNQFYIKNHPYFKSHYSRYLRNTLNIWLWSKYDANINLSHYDSLNYHNTKKATFPIVGEVDATLPSDCEICMDKIPDQIKSVYEVGTNIHALAQLNPDDWNLKRDNNGDFVMHRYNPLLKFDTPLQKIGDFLPDNDYAYNMKTAPDFFIDEEFLKFCKTKDIDALIPPLKPNPIVHDPMKTFSSPYYIKTPSDVSIQEDLELFNQQTYGASSPTVLLMATEMLYQLLSQTVVASDKNPNCPMIPDQVPVRNKHKSSGTPYRKYGDSEFMRNLYGEYRNDLVYHKRHSADQALTLVINKVAISIKHRDRTILAININKSEAGRSLHRWLLEKIKATANIGGPILIGLIAQYGGWDRIYKNLYTDSPATIPEKQEHVMLGGKDYPKWDRRISNTLQLITSLTAFHLIDPVQQQRKNSATLSETWHEILAETIQIIYDYLVFGKSLYQKPGGVTSGNSRTADGNSLLHILIDMYAIIIQMIQSTPENFKLDRDLRDPLCKTVFEVIPADYLSDTEPKLFYNQSRLNQIRKRIAKGAYLSDDGLLVHDTRIIRYDDFMHESLLLSTYDMPNNKHKYHQDPIGRKAREFLSQDTFDFGDMSYPLADFGRIYSAMILSDKRTVLDPQINLTRMLSLYSFLYCYYYYYRDKPDHPILKFLDTVRDYLEQRIEHQDDDYLYHIVLDVAEGQDRQFDFKNCDMFENFDYLWGFDLSSEYPKYLLHNRHRYRRLSPFKCQLLDNALIEYNLHNEARLSAYICYVCSNPATFITCEDCSRAFCNTAIDSHLEQHYISSSHRKYSINCKILRCHECGNSDISVLYRDTNKYLCTQHKKPNSVKLVIADENNNIQLRVLVTEQPRVNFMNKCYENYSAIHSDGMTAAQFQRLVNCYLDQDYRIRDSNLTAKIRIRMQLASYGIVRPYHQLLLQLTKLESKVLDSEIIDIPITSLFVEEDINFLEISQEYKLDPHSTYSYLQGTREINIIINYKRLSDSRSHIWSTDTMLPANLKYIRQRRLNTLTSILRNSTQNVPEYLKLLLSWNTQLSAYDPTFPLIKDNNFPAPYIVHRVNEVLRLVNKRRFQVIFGGPGTGKSTLLSYLIYHLHQNNKKIIVYTPSHQSANALLYKIAAIFAALRCNRPGLLRITTDGMKEQPIDTAYINYRPNMLEHDRIAVTTIQSFSTVQHIKNVDLVILDEFSLTADNYLISGLQHFKPTTRVLFSGDPRQLSSVDALRKPLDPRYHTLINYYTETYPTEVYVLEEHYRCHPEIFKVFNDIYYSDKVIKCKVQPHERNIPPLQPFNTIQVERPEYRNQGVVLNQDEIEKVQELLHLIMQVLDLNYVESKPHTVSIICSYRSQLQTFITLQQANQIPQSIILSTIDSAQGDESDIVILCLSQLNQFTLNPNRFNVAMSRARCSLFVTVPPLESTYGMSEQQVKVCNILSDREHFYCYHLYNEGKYFITSPTQIKNESIPEYTNIREHFKEFLSMSQFYDIKYPINPIQDDYIFFDTEFLNPLNSRSEPVMLAYGMIHKNNTRRISGTPVRYIRAEHFNGFNKSIYSFKSTDKPLKSTYATGYLFADAEKSKSYYQLLNYVNSGIATNTSVDLVHILNYCRHNIHVRPVFVTFSGSTDHAFIMANSLIIQPQHTCNITHRCRAPPVYASYVNRQRYLLCSYHAHSTPDDLQLTHFVNPEIIDFKVEFRSGGTSMLVTRHNNTIIAKQELERIANYKLETLHHTYCTHHCTNLQAHDPAEDARMTRCLYLSFVEPKLRSEIYSLNGNIKYFLNMEYRLKDFDGEFCKVRRELQLQWYESYKTLNLSHCNLGSGKQPLSEALHNSDIVQGKKNPLNNMNTHTCDSLEHIYFDSHWYKTTPYQKPSYLFYDTNPIHYYTLGNTGLSLYLCSKKAQYIHTFTTPTGINIFRTMLHENCSNESLRHESILPTLENLPQCVTSALRPTSKDLVYGQICSKHYEQLKLIEAISTAYNYGYRFEYIVPETSTIQNQNIIYRQVPTNWDPTQLEIPGYQTRPLASRNHMQIKARGVLGMYQTALLYTDNKLLPADHLLINIGAASYSGTTPMADEIKNHLNKTRIINVDPRLKTSDENNLKTTIQNLLSVPGYEAHLIISDIYTDTHDIMPALVEFSEKHLQEHGTLIFKITSRSATFQNLDALQKFSHEFKYVKVQNLHAVPNSSELWVIFSDRQKPTVQGWMEHHLVRELRMHWYAMQFSTKAEYMSTRLYPFKYTKHSHA